MTKCLFCSTEFHQPLLFERDGAVLIDGEIAHHVHSVHGYPPELFSRWVHEIAVAVAS